MGKHEKRHAFKHVGSIWQDRNFCIPLQAWVYVAGYRYGPKQRIVSFTRLLLIFYWRLCRAKYLLSIANHVIKRLGPDLTCGYDIGCKFGTMIAKSPLGHLAAEQNHRTVVGSFHGHAHCRVCQICKLLLYTDGQGLTDHEECECYFAESNALASSTRYASRFHCMQAIVQWMKHRDRVDTYSRLSE